MSDRPEHVADTSGGSGTGLSMAPSRETAQDYRDAQTAERSRLEQTNAQLPGVEWLTGLFQGDRGRPGDLVAPESHHAQVAQRFGLNIEGVRMQDGRVQHRYFSENAEGEREYIHNADGTAEQAENALNNYRTQMIQSISDKYNVNVRTEGMGANGERLMQPDIWQLTAVDAALSKSRPSMITTNGRQLNIEFPERATFAGGHYTDNGEGPTISIAPDVRNPSSLENTVMHELTHAGQTRLEKEAPGYTERLSAEMGFSKVDSRRGLSDYMLRGTDGRFYRHVDELGPSADKWVRTDDQGRMLNQDGVAVLNWQQAQQHTSQEVANVASVRPWAAGDQRPYFDNPAEMAAEAMAVYRSGEAGRNRLMQHDPNLLAAIQRLDQLEIDNHYGRHPDGTSIRTRLPNGRISRPD